MISSENDLTYLYCSQNLLLSRNTLRDTFLHWIEACTQIRTDDSLDIRYCTISSKGAQEFHSLKEKQRKTEMFAYFSKYYWWTVYAVFLQQSEKGSCFAFLRFLSSFWEGNDLVRKMRYPLLLSSLHSATLLDFIQLILRWINVRGHRFSFEFCKLFT